MSCADDRHPCVGTGLGAVSAADLRRGADAADGGERVLLAQAAAAIEGLAARAEAAEAALRVCRAMRDEMTSDERDYIATLCAIARVLGHDSNAQRPFSALVDDVRALRSLPVLRSCWDCYYNDASGHACSHPKTRGRALENGAETVPAWCPLRG